LSTNISINPNPYQGGQFKIQSSLENYDVLLYDVQGKVYRANNKNYSSIVSSMENDLYILHIYKQNESKGFSSYFISFETGARLELMHNKSMEDTVKQCVKEEHGLAHFALSPGSESTVNALTGDGYYESVILDPEGNYIEITI